MSEPIDVALRGAMIERADEWMNKNRVSPTWRIIDELRNEVVRMAAHDAEVARAAKAEAWDEGYDRGFYDREQMPGESRDASEGPSVNPYREVATDE